jgi:hypothetical protein
VRCVRAAAIGRHDRQRLGTLAAFIMVTVKGKHAS